MRSAADTHCRACGAQVDALLVDLSEPPDAAEAPVERPARTRELVTVVGVLLALAVGAGFLLTGDDDTEVSKAAPSTGLDEAAPVPEPTVPPAPTPAPSPEGAGEPAPADAEDVVLTDMAPLLGDLSGLSLAWSDAGQVHIVDLDTGVERQVDLGGSAFDNQIAAVGGRIVTRSDGRLAVIGADGEIVEWDVGRVDQFFGLADGEGVWVTRFPRSEQSSPEVAFVALDLFGEGIPRWHELPRFAWANTVTSEGLIVSLWQGRPFVFRADGTTDQLPYDGVLSATADHLLTFTCVGGTELTCPASLVDVEAATERPVDVDTTDPWSWQLAPGGEHIYWVDWSAFPTEHHVRDVRGGGDITITGEAAAFDQPMRFSSDGEWVVGAGAEGVVMHRLSDGHQVSIPIALPQFEGSREFVVFSNAQPA